ncbi:histidine triad nucleotide-binding protein [Buchnera aphidicola]|uniref:histidine triad nucleotide-binding protein n=1 Tax=Buchnera aphidicola TaxID=9 RepID=UPI0034646F2E
MKHESLFQDIINKKTPENIIYQDTIVTAFKDINPKAPVHILIVPNIFISSLNEINEKNKDILAHMFSIAIKIAKQKKISKEGYKIIVNCNKNGGQEINYLHMHLLGGKKLNSLY